MSRLQRRSSVHYSKWEEIQENLQRHLSGTTKKVRPAGSDDDFGDGKRDRHEDETAGPSLRAILPQVISEQNRKKFGTWQRQFDFTRTILGYLLGIHNFFRFPYLCYKFGGVFMIPYVFMMFFVGVPTVFMEFTIGQYYGVGSYVAFTQMAPIMSFVSKMLTWSCVLNTWMFTLIIAWIRNYSSDSSSCLKGWEGCNPDFFFNSPHCFTAAVDNDCNDPSLAKTHNLSEDFVINHEMLYFNFRCQSVEMFCKSHGWKLADGKRKCVDDKGTPHSIYERRFHATAEYFYGELLGLKRNMEAARKWHLTQDVLEKGGFADVEELRKALFKPKLKKVFKEELRHKANASELVRIYIRELRINTSATELYYDIIDGVVNATRQEEYWTPHGKQFIVNEESSSFKLIEKLSLTTWILIAVFLFEDLLSVSLLSYVLNAFPFLILVYITYIAFSFVYSGYGIEQLLTTQKGFLTDLLNPEMWAEACIQTFYTSGIGNGVLISLATFNNFEHGYLFDLYFTLTCSIITSCCGVLICFCTLGHYLKQNDIDVPFREYIKMESTTSSVEFCFVVYSHFLTLINDNYVVTIVFFFMFNSFATDSVVRLVQNVLDSILALAPRLRHHETFVLIGLCLMGYFMNVPMMRNGSIVLYIDFEYYTIRYIIPTIIMIEIGMTVFVYRATRILDHAEQMGVYSTRTFRYYMIGSMYAAFLLVLGTIILNVYGHKKRRERFNGEEEQSFTEVFGWVLYTSPLLMAALSVIKQLIVVPPKRWPWLLIPLQGKDRKGRRAFARRVGGGHKDHRTDEADETDEVTDQEKLREATARWRKLESEVMIEMMERQREELLQQKGALSSPHGKKSMLPEPKLESDKPPLFMSLVRAATAAMKAKAEEEEMERKQLATKKRRSTFDVSALDTTQRKKTNPTHQTSHGTFSGRLKMAFMGKASKTGTYIPRRHAGGAVHPRIVTKRTADGVTTMHYMQGENADDEEEQDSAESSHDDDGEAEEQLRIKYLNFMDYFERWPGRLDESEIESEESTASESDHEGPYDFL